MSFLTLEQFLGFFPRIEISRELFIDRFTVTYRGNPSLRQLFDRDAILNRKSVIKSFDDARYVNRDLVIDYFYDVIIINRHKYLENFFNSYFGFKNPYSLKWNVDPSINIVAISPALLRDADSPDTTRRETALQRLLDGGVSTVSVQKNDSSRIMIRNLNYLDILHTTRIQNTSKSRISFWQTFLNVYNQLTLEDRFFAPSSIGLYLREKKAGGVNFNNFFYLFQQYQPKASILNPFTVYWILQNYFKGSTLFTPVLSWSSYLTAFFHSDYQHYVGVDVIPRVCDRARGLADYYFQLKPENRRRRVEIYCQRSESLLESPEFLNQYRGYFDTVLWCPPYFNMELYEGDQQSTAMYPDYDQWLEEYFRATVKLCHLVCTRSATVGIIMNDYYLLDGSFYPLINDFHSIVSEYFTLVNVVELVNRASPLRVNKKGRTEKLFLYRGGT